MPFPEDRGWKDTVWVDGRGAACFISVIFLGTSVLFNSQTLEMADNGSIGQLLVNPVPNGPIQCPTEWWGIENYSVCVFIVYRVENNLAASDRGK